jgi:hypothetical protein
MPSSRRECRSISPIGMFISFFTIASIYESKLPSICPRLLFCTGGTIRSRNLASNLPTILTSGKLLRLNHKSTEDSFRPPPQGFTERVPRLWKSDVTARDGLSEITLSGGSFPKGEPRDRSELLSQCPRTAAEWLAPRETQRVRNPVFVIRV